MWCFCTVIMYDLMFFICSTAGKRQKPAARGAWVPSSQSKTEKNHSVGFRGVKRMLNSFQYCPTEMFRIKTNGLVKVPVLVLSLYAAYTYVPGIRRIQKLSCKLFYSFWFSKTALRYRSVKWVKDVWQRVVMLINHPKAQELIQEGFFLFGLICFCKIEIKMWIG